MGHEVLVQATGRRGRAALAPAAAVSPANRYGPSGLLPSEAFSQLWRGRQQEEAARRNRTRTPFGTWSEAIHEPQTGKLDFSRFPYQREPYEESGELAEMVVEKGTQVGFSTLMLRWVLWIADEWARTAMYVMPTEDVVKKFSAERIAPVIQGSDHLSGLLGPQDPNNMGLRKIGRGFVHFVGSMVASALDSVPAMALVLDEYDTLNQINIPVAEERVGASPHPMIRRIGVPSLDGIGIDAQYQASDMRRWLVRCEACNEWQQITMDNLRWEQTGPDRYNAWRVCAHCLKRGRERELDVRQGRWVAEYPDRDVRGYHVPRLIVPSADMGRVVAKSRSTKVEVRESHHHRDLAEPFETPEDRLSRAAIESCKRAGIELAESYTGLMPVTMGVDQASARAITVRISEHLNEDEKRALALVEVEDDEPGDPDAKSAIRKLGVLIDVFKVRMVGIDHAPDGRLARALVRAFPGRVIMVALSDVLRAPMTPVPELHKAEQLVTVNRTMLLDATLDLFRWQRNLLPGRSLLPEGYEEALRNQVRRRVVRPDGRTVHRYEKAGKDDWLFAELFDVVATEVFKLRILEGRVGDLVTSERTLEPEVPTANFNDWDGRPWDEPYRPGGDSADPSEGEADWWGDGYEYRP